MMGGRVPKRSAYDHWLFFTALLLVIAGLLMVGSSSNYVAMKAGKSPSAFLFKQLLHVGFGMVLLIAAARIDYKSLQRRSVIYWGIGLCVILLLAVLAFPPINGARRWIPIGPFMFQPSEFAKLFAVVFMAYLLSRRSDRVNDLLSVPIPALCAIGGLALLIVIEPDLGSAVLVVAVSAVMIFVAGLRWRYVFSAGALGVLAFIVGVLVEPYRIQRVVSWIEALRNPAQDALGVNFQRFQSLIALGTGGFSGVGFGDGLQKAHFVPASHTDFIFSIVGEELGLLGTIGLLAAFGVIFWRGMRAAVRAPDSFGFYLALGITSMLVIQALINMGVCLGLLPTKGLPLPLVSYGGSSLLASMTAIGLLFNVSQHSN